MKRKATKGPIDVTSDDSDEDTQESDTSNKSLVVECCSEYVQPKHPYHETMIVRECQPAAEGGGDGEAGETFGGEEGQGLCGGGRVRAGQKQGKQGGYGHPGGCIQDAGVAGRETEPATGPAHKEG